MSVRGDQLTYVGALTVVVCTCGLRFAIPDDLNDRALADHSIIIHCPIGDHRWHYTGETEAQKEKRLRKWAEDQAAAARARADQAEASLRTTKGHVTRLPKPVQGGQCPFCGKYLVELDLHVTRRHPGQEVENEAIKESSDHD